MVGEALGHYRIIEKIGRGGMGEVYRACDDRLDRDIALKVLSNGAIADEATRKRFHKEALILAKLNHPNIATIHDFTSQDGVDLLVMELISGKSLKELLSEGPLAEREVQRLGFQLADGLAAAHQLGVVHRDLKPSNIMVTTDGRLKILDFGLAKLVQGASRDLAEGSSEDNALRGTLPYMAPEQLKGKPVDGRTDIYAVGAVLYEMTTGQCPFLETNSAMLIDSILHKTPQPPCELNRLLSSGMQRIIMNALAKAPEDRQQSVHELRQGLEKLSLAAASQQPSTASLEPSQLEASERTALEIAHVLFFDLVQYSTLPMEDQRRRLRELHNIARTTTEFVRANCAKQLICLPTGDGMALVFFGDPEAPIRCAVEVSRAIAGKPELKLRMGVHSGPVYRVPDINAAANVAGGGINLAQRVMDSGEAGHILVSQAVADVLKQLSQWSSALHDLGEVEVKHGVRIRVFNFYMDGVGNPKTPSKVKTAKGPRKQGVAKRTPAQRPISASSRRQRAIRPLPLEQDHQNSTSKHTVEISLPKVSRRIWVSFAICIAVLGATTVYVPTLRHWLFHMGSARTSTPPNGIPSMDEGKHVIVLPFDVQGDRDTLSYIAEGLDEELSRKLSALPTLHIVSASAVEKQAKAQKIDLKGPAETIARNFGVNLIVHGTVQQGGGWTRINIDFDNVPDSGRLFTLPFSYSAADMNLLDLENQVYNSIVRVLHLRPSSQEQKRASNPTANNDAYGQYLQGYALSRHAGTQEINDSIGFYQRAIQEDQGFALAYVRLSEAYRRMYTRTSDPSWVHKAVESAQQAEKLNTELPEVHLALGDTFRQLGQTAKAVDEFECAKKLSPNSDQPWLRLGATYVAAGELDQAIDAYRKATQLDPYSLVNRNELGYAYYRQQKYDKALGEFHSIIDLDPGNYLGHMNSGAVYLAQGKYQDSIHEFEKALEVAHHATDDAEIHSDLGTAYFYEGRYSDAVKEDEKAVKISPNEYELVGNLADAYRWAGRKKQTREAYESAIELANKHLEINPSDTEALGSLSLYYAKDGDLIRAEDCIRRARLLDPSNAELILYEGTVQVMARERLEALESLKLALEKGYPPELLTVDPEFTSLRSNPEFEKLLKEYSGTSN